MTIESKNLEKEPEKKENSDSEDDSDSDTKSETGSDTFEQNLETDLSFSIGNEIFSCNFHPYKDLVAFGTINGKVHVYEYNYGGKG